MIFSELKKKPVYTPRFVLISEWEQAGGPNPVKEDEDEG
jgi:hypothetical protein